MSGTILVGDVRAMLATLPERSVQTCVTSPPYYGLRDYGVEGQIGIEATPDAYVAALVDVFRAVRRVLRDDGTLWLNLGDSYAMSTRGAGGNGKQQSNVGSVLHNRAWRVPASLKPKGLIGIPWRVAFALQADGWYLRSEITWCKRNPMPESVTDRPTNATEKVFLLSKHSRYFYDAEAVKEPSVHEGRIVKASRPNSKIASAPDAVNDRRTAAGLAQHDTIVSSVRNMRNFWLLSSDPYPHAHFATYPEAIPEKAILAGTSERGGCPACGAPWRRVVERTRDRTTTRGMSAWSAGSAIGRPQQDAAISGLPVVTAIEAGWQSSCRCEAGDPVPQTVLDPFLGSGTTGAVANRLGRRWVGIDLNPEYAEMARRRTAQQGFAAAAGCAQICPEDGEESA